MTDQAPQATKTTALTHIIRIVIIAGVIVGSIYGGAEVKAIYKKHFPLVSEVVPGVLYRSPQPHHTMGRIIDKYSIKTVVNLRPRSEDPAAFDAQRDRCHEAGIDFVSLPWAGYACPEDIVEDFLRIARADEGAVLVHCEYGKARTGLLVAAYRILLQGWSVQDAVDEMPLYRYRFTDDGHAERVAQLQQIARDKQLWLARTTPQGISPEVTPTTQPAGM